MDSLRPRLPLMVVALVACLCLLAVAGAASSFPELSGSGLDEVNYHIEYRQGSDTTDDDIKDGVTPRGGDEVMMTRHDGVRFRCTLPGVVAPEPDGQSHNLPRPSIASLLAPLKQNCLYRLEGWWTYEFCYGKLVQQFHQEGESRVALFTLGLAPFAEDQDEEDQRAKIMTDDGERLAYTELYTDGTLCDITGKPRTVQLHYYCMPTARTGMLLSFKEPSTCNYVVNVATSLLCAHPDFRIEEKPDYAITCREVDSDETTDDEGELQLDPPSWLLQEDSSSTSSPSSSPPPPPPADQTEL